jgi:hypothetical protein
VKSPEDFGELSANVIVVLRQVGQTPVGQLVSVVKLKKIFFSNFMFNLSIFQTLSLSDLQILKFMLVDKINKSVIVSIPGYSCRSGAANARPAGHFGPPRHFEWHGKEFSL